MLYTLVGGMIISARIGMTDRGHFRWVASHLYKSTAGGDCLAASRLETTRDEAISRVRSYLSGFDPQYEVEQNPNF